MTEHRPQPRELHRHHVWPLSMGGPDTEANCVWIDPVCHVNTHELLRLYEKHEGTPPWEERRHFNAYTRDLARRGWEMHTGASS